MNNKHGVPNQFKHGVNYMKYVKLRKTAAGVHLREEPF